MKLSKMFILSRYWNRLAFCVMRIGRKMIWDQAGKNGYLLVDGTVSTNTAYEILCNKNRKRRRR